MRNLTPLLLVLAAAAIEGCAARYEYVPATGVTSPMGARQAAAYGVPPDAPRGEVKIASYGLVKIASETAAEWQLRALHLRMAVYNGSDRAWTLDTREQQIDLDGRGQSAPAFASANPGTPPPLVTIPPGDRRTVDLFFPLPSDLQGAGELPTFDAVWRLSAGDEVVVQRTPFERLGGEPLDHGPYDYGSSDYYWGPPYWYNPSYPGLGFAGAVEVGPHSAGHPIVIHHEEGHFHRGGEPIGPARHAPAETPPHGPGPAHGPDGAPPHGPEEGAGHHG